MQKERDRKVCNSKMRGLDPHHVKPLVFSAIAFFSLETAAAAPALLPFKVQTRTCDCLALAYDERWGAAGPAGGGRPRARKPIGFNSIRFSTSGVEVGERGLVCGLQ